jgi:hypothetical protein
VKCCACGSCHLDEIGDDGVELLLEDVDQLLLLHVHDREAEGVDQLATL